MSVLSENIPKINFQHKVDVFYQLYLVLCYYHVDGMEVLHLSLLETVFVVLMHYDELPRNHRHLNFLVLQQSHRRIDLLHHQQIHP